ncbi:sigma-70 family RNA polymerase sigma factor [Candidatus Poribacteria bacterium]|nr:sigma-70 family RNA polymerase sigma factor [Candidatus Poribacteria bacterium]
MTHQDEILVHRAQEGDTQAFGQLVEKYQAAIHGLAFQLVQNVEDAYDLAQDAFIKAYTHLDQLNEPSKFLSWLRQIVANESRMFLRQRKEADSLDEMADFQDVVSICRRTRLPDENVINAEFREMFLSALMALPADDRLVLTLQYMENMTYNEIAEFKEILPTTVIGEIQRAHQRLRKELEKLMASGLSHYRPGREFTEDVLDQISILASGDFVLEKAEDRLIWRMYRSSGRSPIQTPAPMYMVLHYVIHPEILLQYPITVSDLWFGEVTQGARKGWVGITTVPSDSEQVQAAAGRFSDCLLLKTEITGKGVFANIHRDSSVSESDFGKLVPQAVNDFICGARLMWFAKGVGLVQVRYEHRDGTITSIKLTDFRHVERVRSADSACGAASPLYHKAVQDDYFPLAVGNTWRYEWTNSTADVVIKETLTIASQRNNRYTFHCFSHE